MDRRAVPPSAAIPPARRAGRNARPAPRRGREWLVLGVLPESEVPVRAADGAGAAGDPLRAAYLQRSSPRRGRVPALRRPWRRTSCAELVVENGEVGWGSLPTYYRNGLWSSRPFQPPPRGSIHEGKPVDTAPPGPFTFGDPPALPRPRAPARRS
jgi:hypothetical protein